MADFYEYELNDGATAARAVESERAGFIRRTYMHLALAILAFVGIEALMFNVFFPTKGEMTQFVAQFFGNPLSMIILLVAFIGFGWLAQSWARSETSPAVQYLGLATYVVLEAIIFLPILCIAVYYVRTPVDPNGFTQVPILWQAAILTLAMFGGLTAAVMVTGKDFSFLGPILCLCSFIALGVVIAGMLFGFSLGLFFSFAMVALASGYILYDTSNVLHHYNTNQHVAAALALFASVALLFYYILRILIALNSNRN